MDLENAIKTMMGRKLTAEELEMCKTKAQVRKGLFDDKLICYEILDGKPTTTQTNYNIFGDKDARGHMKIPIVKWVRSTYNEEGLLIARDTMKQNELFRTDTTRTYNPPGSYFGKKER